MKKLYIKRLGTDEVVREIPISKGKEHKVETIMMGILRQMNTEEYCIDDSEFDERERS